MGDAVAEKVMGYRHVFSDNFFRAEIDPERIGVQHYEEAIIQDIEFAAVQTGARIVIIDNLTYLCNSSEKGDVAGLACRSVNWAVSRLPPALNMFTAAVCLRLWAV
jgi:hypothetical protein